MKRRFIRVISVILLACTVMPAHAQAATSSRKEVTISPFLQQVTINGDEPTKNLQFELTNNTDAKQEFKLSVLDFGSLNETGGVVFAGSNASSLLKKYGLSNWLTLSVKNISLGVKEKAKIQGTIINDSSLSPGGHYAAVVASIDSPRDAPNNIRINQQLSSLIFATKRGGEKYDLSLARITPQRSWLRLPESVKLTFKNPGNVHVSPRGVVRLVGSKGKVIKQGIINQESSLILPETERQYVVALSSLAGPGLWPSVYKIEVDYRYDGLETFAHKKHEIFYSNALGIALMALILTAIIYAGIRFWPTLIKIVKKKA